MQDLVSPPSSARKGNGGGSAAKKRKPQQDSFVFLSDVDSDSSSSPSSEGEKEEDEKEAKRKTSKKKPATPRSNKKKQNEPSSSSLFAQLQRAKANAAALARDWLARSNDLHEPAVVELLELMLQSAGGTAPPSSSSGRFKRNAVQTLDNLVTEYTFSASSPITSTSKANERFHANYSAVFYEMGRLIKPATLESIILALKATVAASLCQARPQVRVAGTLAGMQLGNGLLAKSAELRKDANKTLQVFLTEEQTCEASMTLGPKLTKLTKTAGEFTAAATELLAYSSTKDSTVVKEDRLDGTFEHLQEKLERWREAGRTAPDKLRQIAADLVKTCKDLRQCETLALELSDSVFVSIAQSRFRDVDALVRMETARQLGAWAQTYRAAMCVSQRSKYFAWMLPDKYAGVRVEALRALAVLGRGETEALAPFVNKFAGRVQEMLQDVDETVVCNTLHLVQAWVESGLVSRDEFTELAFDCEELLFAEEELVAFAAAAAVQKLDLRLEHEDVVVRTRTLCTLVLKHVAGEDDDNGEEGEGLQLVQTAHMECVKAAEAFQDHEVCTVDSVCELLGEEAFCQQSAHLPRMLCAMLHSLLQQPGVKKSSSSAATAAGRKLVDFLIRFRADEHCLESLVGCLPLVKFANPELLNRALGELVKTSTERRTVGLLNASASAIAAVLKTNHGHEALGKICATVRLQLDSEAGMARCAALTIGVADAGKQIVLDPHELLERVLAHSEVDAWLCDAVQTLVFLLQDAKQINKCFVHVLHLAFPVDLAPGLTCRILGLFHDARSLFWPGEEQGWNPSEALVMTADGVFMDMLANAESSSSGLDLQEAVCNQVLLPHARVALFASQFKDSKTPAFVLRFSGYEHQPEFKRVALKLNTELRKQDPIRWLMAHLETICLDANYAEGLIKLLGPPSLKAAQQIGKAVSIMVCEAIRIAVAKRDDGVLSAVAPYLQFCKDDKNRAHVINLWEKEALEVVQEEQFGELFADRLYNRKAVKKPRASTASARGMEDDDEEDEDLEVIRTRRTPTKRAKVATPSEDTPRRTSTKRKAAIRASESFSGRTPTAAQPLQFKKSKTEEQKEEEEEEDLERSVFEEEEEQQQQAVEETPEDEDEDDEEVIGFRPRTTWS
ncbi:hypothetical protein BASA81_001605 [Batrachochytrium salamandrivorans]|nr:hypothetical protein BASA81_001605 [Batrachochytrium salamandrivorans]